MRQDYAGFDYIDTKEVNWSTICQGDLVFIQRPFKEEHWQIVEMCKKWGVPVVADFDDLLSDLSTSNPAFEVFNASKQSFLKIIKAVDGITVTTQYLGDKLAELGATCPIQIIPNAYDSQLFPYTKNVIERQKIILWRGGNSHVEDLMSIKDEHEALIKDFPDWNFVFLAQDPWWLTPRDNIKHVGGMGILEYMHAIHAMAPAIMYHPLTDTDFNRSKSMCSYIEAAHARAAFIAPDFEEFKRAGVQTYKQGEFYNVASKLMSSVDMIRDSILSARSYVAENLELREVNKLRYAFLNQILTHKA
jgi:hypothetical protein